jgi:NAD(P)-dependent dehydrogenase (short-subunit alcohol dehydrogenase family)
MYNYGNVSYHFEDHTVVVTGASSGIGRAIALAFGKAGATVINGDVRSNPKIGDIPTHERIIEEGGEAALIKTDVTKPDQLLDLVDSADEYGGLDIFVNNAGVLDHSPFLETDEAMLDKHYRVNVKGVYFGTQAAAQKMTEAGEGGSIVNVASVSSRVAQGNIVHYEASKGAVEMITRGAALELASDDIRINAVAPGVVPTEIYEGYSEMYHNEADRADLAKPIPMERSGQPSEVAEATLFLASDAAGYTTGHLLFVDGGWMIV